jgi:hypothetical protein
MLAGFDKEYCDAKARDASTTNANRLTKDKGVGYDKGMYGGMGLMFGARGNRGRTDPGRDAGRQRAQDAEKQKDKFYQYLYSFLAALCPSPDRDRPDTSRFDVDPPKAVVSMLVNSKVLDKAVELLRNDSLDDASKRKDLYMAFFGFLRNVGVHEASKQAVIFSERVVLRENVNLLSLSFGGLLLTNASPTASSLAENLRRFNIQSQVMLSGAQRARHDFQDQQGTDLLWLCWEISDLSAYLKIGEGGASRVDHGIVEVPDDQIWPTYRFARNG